MADFIGFTLNGVHSSDLGIVRTSNGSRFDESLLPSATDRTTQITGRDGTLYFGRDYKSSSITVSIAYDNMSEEQMRRLREILAIKNPVTLTFDEAPYKTYWVVSSQNSKLSYIVFDKNDPIQTEGTITDKNDLYGSGYNYAMGRVYKGEGSLAFTLYDIYGHCSGNNKYLDAYTPEQIYDWNGAVGLKYHSGLDSWISANNKFVVYNPGSFAAKPIITLTPSTGVNTTILTLGTQTMSLKVTELMSNDTKIVIDSEKELIIGANNNGLTGNLYNQYITSGYFITIPCCYNISTRTGTMHDLSITGAVTTTNTPSINYNYLFG